MRPKHPALRLPKRYFARIVTIGVAQAITLVVSVVLLRDVIDSMGRDPEMVRPLVRSLALLVMVMMAGSLLRAAEFKVSERMGYEYVRLLRMAMYNHFLTISPHHLQRRSRGALFLRFTGDLSMIRTWVSRGAARGTTSAIVLLGGATVLLVLNVEIALALLSALCFGSACSLRLGSRLQRATRSVRRKRSLLMSNVDEQVNNLAVVQVFGRSRGEYARMGRLNDSLTRSLFNLASERAKLRGLSAATASVATVAVLIVGAIQVAAGTATVGLVVSAIVAVRHLSGPVRTLGLAHDYWQSAQVSSAKICEFLRSPTQLEDSPGGESLRVRGGRIEFREVSVRQALDRITATAAPGELVAVMGPSGAGKSTLLSLVARMVEPDTGEVVIDGQSYEMCTPQSTFRHVGMVSQDLPLMRGTIRRNLTYRLPRATEEDVHQAVMAWELDYLLADLPEGMATWLTEGGKNLSSGQRQRLALARAWIGNPPILLLDEPTTNLDPPARELFRRVIAHHRGTVLLVTHDPGEASLADHVWTMESGRIIEVLCGEEYRDRQWLAGRVESR
jgi:ATP-binding cassette subfamily B protein